MVEASKLNTQDYSKTRSILKDAVSGQVVTRFPPEPSGYLHIGHVKAAMMNYHYAKMHEGKMILRFDDTNPMNEKEEFEENIKRDLKTLGITPDQVTYSSDNFEMLQDYMRQLITMGLAYADNTPAEEMKEQRDEGIESTHRSNTVEVNLALFAKMLKGEETKYCIRAKLNMQDKVKCLRDPVFYRCKDVPHHRTGDKFKAYPTYDFTCPIVDSKEGVTHALRTIEYRDRNALYAWVQSTLGLRPVEIYDFSKLNLLSTCLSKRKLKWFVENNIVDGWSDPRFPTIQGIMRRGMTTEALKNFMLEQGPSRNTVNMEWDKIWAVNKQILDKVVPRYMCIGKNTNVKLVIENGPETPEAISVLLHAKAPELGHKATMIGKNLLIEAEDAKTIKVGDRITLMKWGNARVTKVADAAGDFISATIDVTDMDFKGTAKLSWIIDDPAFTTEVKLCEFDHLITKPKVEEGDDIEAIFNKNSSFSSEGIAEGVIANLPQGSYFQFERRGFYYLDKVGFTNQQVTCNFIPDGKTKGMSILSHAVDAKESAKGKGVVESAKQQAATGPDGKMSKKALAKEAKKAAKNAKKSGDPAPEGDAKVNKKGAKGDAKPKATAAASAPAQSNAFGGAAADHLESLLGDLQWFGGAKPSQADAEAVRLLGKSIPDAEAHPNLFGWAAMAKKFKDDIMKTWGAGQLQLPAGGFQTAPASTPVLGGMTYFAGPNADLWESMLVASGAQWLNGSKLTQADALAAKLLGKLMPNPATHPSLFAWAAMVTKFSDAASGKWAAGDLQQAGASEAPKAKESAPKKGKKEEAKAEPAAAEEDEFDPFADDPEADAAAAAAMKKKGEEAKADKAKAKKAGPVAKSLIVWEVKPWGEETDLNALGAKILAIEMDGLFWKTEWKKEPVAFGIFKIQIGATVEDDKVSTDLVQEAIEAFEDDVQSVDIVAFNKL